MNYEDFVGKKINRLTVCSFTKEQKYKKTGAKNGFLFWFDCRCDCGNTKRINVFDVIKGKTTSCGCYKKEAKKISRLTHGMSYTRIYKIWRAIWYRCKYPSCKEYKNYGGRGINICYEWDNKNKNGFLNFKNWAYKNGYSDNLSIDRIDVNGNYEPSNCRWIPLKMQQQNTTRSRFITYKGETHCVSEWARIYGISPGLLERRVLDGFKIDKNIFNKPKENCGGAPKKVICVETGCVFDSASKASLANGVDRNCVGISIRNGWTCCGYHWRYV